MDYIRSFFHRFHHEEMAKLQAHEMKLVEEIKNLKAEVAAKKIRFDDLCSQLDDESLTSMRNFEGC
jgi:hypothetical protein